MIESKALAKSIVIMSTAFPISILLVRSFNNSKRLVHVERLSLKPCCSVLIILNLLQ